MILIAQLAIASDRLNATDVFTGPPAAHSLRIRDDLPAKGGPLRRFVVEERVGVKRSDELVRVPLFFHAGDCSEPNALRVFAANDAERKSPIPYQADDIRLASDGTVARMHLYFLADVPAWGRKEYVVIAGSGSAKALPPVPLERTGDTVALKGDDLQLTFWTTGQKAGGIAAIGVKHGSVKLPHKMLAPNLTLQRQTDDLKIARTANVSYVGDPNLEIRDVRHGSGPLFAKFVVRVGQKGLPDSAEFTYHVPRTGSFFIQTERLFPDELDTADVVGAAKNNLLSGRIVLGDDPADQAIVRAPAGLRKLTRSFQGFTNAALVNAKSGISLFPVPSVQTGMKTITLDPMGYVAFQGTDDFKRTAGANSGRLRAFWGQVRFVFSKAVTPDELWEVGRAHFQPLTAIVDEPGITTDDLHAEFKEIMTQFPPLHSRSWMQDCGRLYILDDKASLTRTLTVAGGKRADDSVDFWLDGAKKAYAVLSKDGTVRVKEFEKGRASGPLDPWNLTYAASPMFSLASLVQTNDRLDRISLAIARAQKVFNGRVDAHGFPHIDCFNTAFNMQIGSIHAGLIAGPKAKDLELSQFYRDAARAGPTLDIYGHGQRTYPSLPKGPGNSDLLYMCTTDFFLRVAEICSGEDLWLHPAVYGRYFDCIDVTADRQHRLLGEPKKSGNWLAPLSNDRANFFRGQCHDHRWESWAAGPYLGILRHAPDGGTIGLTEAVRAARHDKGHWINWPELTTFAQTDIMIRDGLKQYRPPSAPPLPADLKVTHADGKATLRWSPVAGDILGYRIYRSDTMGGPWTLVNSPYIQPPVKLIAGTEFTDPAAKAGQVYFVTAIDQNRRESRWFADEPEPRPAK